MLGDEDALLIDMAADRGAFIDQSQSFNVFMVEPNYAKLSSMHFYAWKKGLKTGMYYLRTKAATDAIKFTVDQTSSPRRRRRTARPRRTTRRRRPRRARRSPRSASRARVKRSEPERDAPVIQWSTYCVERETRN